MDDVKAIIILKRIEENGGLINYPVPLSYESAQEMITAGYAKTKWHHEEPSNGRRGRRKKNVKGAIIATLKGKILLRDTTTNRS